MVGPDNPAIQLAAHDLNIPYLVSDNVQYIELSQSAYFCMLPETDVVHNAIMSIVNAYGWSEVAILYDKEEGACHYVFRKTEKFIKQKKKLAIEFIRHVL